MYPTDKVQKISFHDLTFNSTHWITDSDIYQTADFSQDTSISKEEWVASMDAQENNAWQSLHIEAPEQVTPSILASLFAAII